MNSSIVKVMLGCCFVFLLQCSSCTSSSLLKDGERILFFGDSITQLGVKPNGFITLMGDSLSKRFTSTQLIGGGISGNRVPDLQKRLRTDVLDKKPTVVFIYIGINDVWHFALNGHGTPIQEYDAGLREMCSIIGYYGARVILCTPTVIGEKYDSSNVQDKLLNEYCGVTRTVAKDLRIQLCDLRTAFIEYLRAHNPENKDRGILTYDSVHLSDEGNRLVAQEMLKSLGN
ncbi:MAG: GDSL-type esterase/lipase family protein [Bacteroidota bacterium]